MEAPQSPCRWREEEAAVPAAEMGTVQMRTLNINIATPSGSLDDPLVGRRRWR